MNFEFTPQKDCGAFTYTFSFTASEFQKLTFSGADRVVLEGVFMKGSIAEGLTALALIAKRAEEYDKQIT